METSWGRCGRDHPARSPRSGPRGPGSLEADLARPATGRYFHRLATSFFMNFKASLASWRSLWYMRRQILVAGTSFSSAKPKASTTMNPS